MIVSVVITLFNIHICQSQTTTSAPVESVNCTICQHSYYDGCNTCSCDSRGSPSCTDISCYTLGDPYCIEPTLTTTTTPSATYDCGNCNTYYDGCNECSCGKRGIAVCTLMYCPSEEMGAAVCHECKAGSIKKDGDCVSIDCLSCQSYNDGCNDCSCGEGSALATSPTCTEKYCFAEGVASCTTCVDGYNLDFYGGECVSCEPVNCFVSPCAVTSATCSYPGAVCMDDYSCGCDFYFVDGHGTALTAEQCTATTAEPVSTAQTAAGGTGITSVGDIGCDTCDGLYYDGCNHCVCDERGLPVCTERACFVMGEAFCTYDCSNCQAYYDGCNDCECDGNGAVSCTEMACDGNEATTPYCDVFHSVGEANKFGTVVGILCGVTIMLSFI